MDSKTLSNSFHPWLTLAAAVVCLGILQGLSASPGAIDAQFQPYGFSQTELAPDSATNRSVLTAKKKQEGSHYPESPDAVVSHHLSALQQASGSNYLSLAAAAFSSFVYPPFHSRAPPHRA
jgi:hypothetical protein